MSKRTLPILLMMLLGVITARSFAVRIKLLPQNHSKRSVYNGNNPSTVLPTAEDPKAPPLTGIELAVSSQASTLPIFRISNPDDSTPDGAPEGWSEFLREAAPSGPTDAPPGVNANLDLTNGKQKELTQDVPLSPGTYIASFSVPVAEANLQAATAPILWTQGVQVHKGKLTRVEVTVPVIAKDQIAQVRLKLDDLNNPFNFLVLEPVLPSRQKEGPYGRWEYYSTSTPWPDNLPLLILKGTYHVTLSISTLGAFSSYRLELPQPIKLDQNGDILIPIPKFNHLTAKILDRKGHPLVGVPLSFKGTGSTLIIADSRGGDIKFRLPEDRYTVKALVLDGAREREVVLARNLDLHRDQDCVWKAPVDAIDFGFH